MTANCSEQEGAELPTATTAQPRSWFPATLHACSRPFWHSTGWRLQILGPNSAYANILRAQRKQSQKPGHGRFLTRRYMLLTCILLRVSCASNSARAHPSGIRTFLAGPHLRDRPEVAIPGVKPHANAPALHMGAYGYYMLAVRA